ncbi:unnamed protein product [Laminaria digitata]
MPKKLFTRRRPYDSSAPASNRVCTYNSTNDGRWGLLAVADSERLCDGCKNDSDVEGDCTCQTSLMVDLQSFDESGATRCFRALGAALLDAPRPPPTAAAAAAATTTADASSSPSSSGCETSPKMNAWKEALLVAIVPDADNPGANVLQLLRPNGAIGGQDDDCLFSVGLPTDQHQHTAGDRRLRKRLRESGLPAVPYHILMWRPSPGVDLIAVVALGGALTVFQIQPETAVLRKVFHDGGAFPPGVVESEEDALKGDMIVLSAGVGEDLRWVVSRASSVVG